MPLARPLVDFLVTLVPPLRPRVLGVISFRFWLRRTKFRALSLRCNPALNIQKRDRPAKRPERRSCPRGAEASSNDRTGERGSFSYANWHSSFSYGGDLNVLNRANSFLETFRPGPSPISFFELNEFSSALRVHILHIVDLIFSRVSHSLDLLEKGYRRVDLRETRNFHKIPDLSLSLSVSSTLSPDNKSNTIPLSTVVLAN